MAQVSSELVCSDPTVRRRIRAGEIPAVRLGGPGSPVRTPRAGLEAWLWSEPQRRTECRERRRRKARSPGPHVCVLAVWSTQRQALEAAGLRGEAMLQENVELVRRLVPGKSGPDLSVEAERPDAGHPRPRVSRMGPPDSVECDVAPSVTRFASGPSGSRYEYSTRLAPPLAHG